MGTFGTPSSYNNTGALGSATNPTTAQGLSRDRENQKAILELPGTQAWVEKTITDGVIIPTSAEVIVLPEGGAPTDSLTTIALTSDGTTTLHEGMPIRLKAANSNTITVVHGTGTNNISTIDGNNVVLDTTWYLELKLINGLWVQQETSAYITANEAKITAETAATPATTTSRGIGRVATSADLVDGATINNGPAFLAAGSEALDSLADLFYKTGDLVASFATTRLGFLLCNGGEYSRVTYARLFTIIGTAFGSGDGTSTFNVPDFRGKTIQGANGNLMAVLAAGLPNLAQTVVFAANSGTTGIGIVAEGQTGLFTATGEYSARFPGLAAGGSAFSAFRFDAHMGNTTYGNSTTVQPPAIAANIFIKY